MNLKGLKFSKMHGIGNDFVIIDESKGEIIPEKDKPEACRFLCDRHFGVGSDGLLIVCSSDKADLGYRMFNPDGSSGKCVEMVLDVLEILFIEIKCIEKSMTVETMCDILTLEVNVENGEPVSFKVNMGLSTFKAEKFQ